MGQRNDVVAKLRPCRRCGRNTRGTSGIGAALALSVPTRVLLRQRLLGDFVTMIREHGSGPTPTVVPAESSGRFGLVERPDRAVRGGATSATSPQAAVARLSKLRITPMRSAASSDRAKRPFVYPVDTGACAPTRHQRRPPPSRKNDLPRKVDPDPCLHARGPLRCLLMEPRHWSSMPCRMKRCGPSDQFLMSLDRPRGPAAQGLARMNPPRKGLRRYPFVCPAQAGAALVRSAAAARSSPPRADMIRAHPDRDLRRVPVVPRDGPEPAEGAGGPARAAFQAPKKLTLHRLPPEKPYASRL